MQTPISAASDRGRYPMSGRRRILARNRTRTAWPYRSVVRVVVAALATTLLLASACGGPATPERDPSPSVTTEPNRPDPTVPPYDAPAPPRTAGPDAHPDTAIAGNGSHDGAGRRRTGSGSTTTRPGTDPNSAKDQPSGGQPDVDPTADVQNKPSGRSRIVDWLLEYTPGSGLAGPGPAPSPGVSSYQEQRVYRALAKGSCAGALSLAERLPNWSRSLYRGAARACLAAFHGRTQLWDGAGKDRDAFAAAGPLGCPESDVYRLLNDLLEAHRQDPTATIERKVGGRVDASTCPRIVAVTPNHGPRSGGQRVTVTGVNLPDRVYIYFGDATLGPVAVHDNRAVITVPSMRRAGARKSGIAVPEWPGDPVAFYVYDRPVPAPAPTAASRRGAV